MNRTIRLTTVIIVAGRQWRWISSKDFPLEVKIAKDMHQLLNIMQMMSMGMRITGAMEIDRQ